MIVTRSAREREFLLLRAYNYWDFPKGELSGEESLHAAALRELFEETGLTSSQLTFPWGQASFATEPYRRGKIAHYFVAQVAPTVSISLPSNPLLGRPEHHEYRWLSYLPARQLLVPRLQHVLDRVHNLIQNETNDACD